MLPMKKSTKFPAWCLCALMLCVCSPYAIGNTEQGTAPKKNPVSPRQVAAKESTPVTDFCAQEKQKIASLPHLKLVLWLEDGEYNAELSDADARTIRELLLAHTRYKAPLKQGREDFWKNIDDAYEPPMTILVFEGDDKTQFLDLSVGFELISQSKNKQLEENGYCFTGVEILLEDSAYQKLLQVLKPYVPAMWKADFERMTK